MRAHAAATISKERNALFASASGTAIPIGNEDALENGKLFPGDELGLDGRSVVRLSGNATIELDPIFLAPRTAPRRSSVHEEMIVGHAVELGALLRDGTNLLGEQLEMKVLENILGFVALRTARHEEAHESRAKLRKQTNQAAVVHRCTPAQARPDRPEAQRIVAISPVQ